METLDTYEDYARATLENFAQTDEAKRFALVEAVKNRLVERVLDVGCGLGQDLLPFAEKCGALCVGIDRAAEVGRLGKQLFAERNLSDLIAFARSAGEKLPFADESFDVVLCRLALPYMKNDAALAEFARVLKPNGAILLKLHAPAFYFGMIRERAKSFNPKLVAYPLICLANGALYQLTERQPTGKFWQGKEVYQTPKLLARRIEKLGLRIESELPDTNRQAPSLLIVKK